MTKYTGDQKQPLHPEADTILYTVGENSIATIKIRNNFWYPSKMVFFLILR